MFREWQTELPRDVDLQPIQLPGRENRILEPAFTRMGPLVESLAKAVIPRSDLPFALFGHSLGAIICFELCRLLRRMRVRAPSHLFVSGHRAPQIPDSDPPVHQLPDREFISELERLNGTPDPVLRESELMSLVLPCLRADFAVAETYVYAHEPPLDCPISVFGGANDCEASRAELAFWEQQTRAQFTLTILPGDHFYLRGRSRSELLRAIARDLSRIAAEPAGVPAPTSVNSRLVEPHS